jgi:hypothetical protein
MCVYKCWYLEAFSSTSARVCVVGLLVRRVLGMLLGLVEAAGRVSLRSYRLVYSAGGKRV